MTDDQIGHVLFAFQFDEKICNLLNFAECKASEYFVQKYQSWIGGEIAGQFELAQVTHR